MHVPILVPVGRHPPVYPGPGRSLSSVEVAQGWTRHSGLGDGRFHDSSLHRDFCPEFGPDSADLLSVSMNLDLFFCMIHRANGFFSSQRSQGYFHERVL